MPGGVWCLVPGGLHAGGVVSGPRGVSMPGGGVWSLGGLHAQGGVWSRGGSPCQTPPLNRMTNSSKNITLATTSLRPVTIRSWFSTGQFLILCKQGVT